MLVRLRTVKERKERFIFADQRNYNFIPV